MGKLILMFEQMGFPENGGAAYVEYPKSLEEMDVRCNELLTRGKNGDKCKIICAGELVSEYIYQPIEKVILFERKECPVD